MYYICGFITLNADFYYVCGLLCLWTLLHWWVLQDLNKICIQYKQKTKQHVNDVINQTQHIFINNGSIQDLMTLEPLSEAVTKDLWEEPMSS